MKIITLSGGRCRVDGCSKETGRKEGPSKKTRRKEGSPQEEIIFGVPPMFSLYFLRICKEFSFMAGCVIFVDHAGMHGHGWPGILREQPRHPLSGPAHVTPATR